MKQNINKIHYFPSDEKKHGCTECDMRFKDKSNLKRHMLTHNNEKPYCCPGCGNRFKQVSNWIYIFYF